MPTRREYLDQEPIKRVHSGKQEQWKRFGEIPADDRGGHHLAVHNRAGGLARPRCGARITSGACGGITSGAISATAARASIDEDVPSTAATGASK